MKPEEQLELELKIDSPLVVEGGGPFGGLITTEEFDFVTNTIYGSNRDTMPTMPTACLYTFEGKHETLNFVPMDVNAILRMAVFMVATHSQRGYYHIFKDRSEIKKDEGTSRMVHRVSLLTLELLDTDGIYKHHLTMAIQYLCLIVLKKRSDMGYGYEMFTKGHAIDPDMEWALDNIVCYEHDYRPRHGMGT